MIKINLKPKELIHGDCLEVLKQLPDNSVDSVVTDPPYGISFMGKKWDYDVPSKEVFSEMLRVLKPGGHMLCACGTRTQHRMAINIEDAGFEIRDVITWLYGSGFPKSMNLKEVRKGWGTALKPACEFFTLARKPLSEKTVAANVLEHGTGGINIDGCRVGSDLIESGRHGRGKTDSIYKDGLAPQYEKSFSHGRWPANLILDEEAANALDEQTGILKSGHLKPIESKKQNQVFGEYAHANVNEFMSNEGGASRFFYVAKASKSERNKGCEKLELKESGVKNDSGRGFSESDPYKKVLNQNNHPTVKPIKLMTYLCRLITPPDGIVLDPYMGSGSTGVAAVKEGFGFIGIEREQEYYEICKARIENIIPLAHTPHHEASSPSLDETSHNEHGPLEMPSGIPSGSHKDHPVS